MCGDLEISHLRRGSYTFMRKDLFDRALNVAYNDVRSIVRLSSNEARNQVP
jgi:hypothetical protein